MFYSQFILAKKGPLGTIWIAAHLERKLRKNQVTDTDIALSVDSILFPEMPIALRLSSHLLLGVVRIYSRKVNYLFDDCSEALLKVKQAFRSTAVDLPPEKSTAPYHSITMPETFDLDDFELPDNDLQGNYVDQHISSKEQITLQDTMEGVLYSTSKFGLDERFGDDDASGLDLDEELFIDKAATPDHANASDNFDQEIDEYDGDNEPVDYAEAPSTPGLWEEPNLPNILETSTCDDRHEPENQTVTEASHQYHHNLFESHEKSPPPVAATEPMLISDLGSTPVTESNLPETVVPMSNDPAKVENLLNKNFGDVPPGFQTAIENRENFKEHQRNQENIVHLTSELESNIGKDNVVSTPQFADSRIPVQLPHASMASSYFPVLTPCVTLLNHESNAQEPRATELWNEKFPETHHAEFGQRHEVRADNVIQKESQVENINSYNNYLPSPVIQKDVQVENINSYSNYHTAPVVQKEVQVENINSYSNYDHAPVIQKEVQVENISSYSNYHPAPVIQKEVQVENINSYSNCHPSPVIQKDVQVENVNNYSNYNSAPVIQKEVQVENNNSYSFYHTASVIQRDVQVENINNNTNDLSAPETRLSLPHWLSDAPKTFVPESTPTEKETASGKKRTFTESSMTAHSLNLNESSGLYTTNATSQSSNLNQSLSLFTTNSTPQNLNLNESSGFYTSTTIQTAQSLNLNQSSSGFTVNMSGKSATNDGDLLSSILVGRKSSILKPKPTPPAVTPSTKRSRSTPKTGLVKRKVLLDNHMVLHGDVMRQQLTNTDDIRRLRKKAPCTRSEISMLEKEFRGDELFREPVFTGVATKLASLHRQLYDLSKIVVSRNDASLADGKDPKPNSQNAGKDTHLEVVPNGPKNVPTARDNHTHNNSTVGYESQPPQAVATQHLAEPLNSEHDHLRKRDTMEIDPKTFPDADIGVSKPIEVEPPTHTDVVPRDTLVEVELPTRDDVNPRDTFVKPAEVEPPMHADVVPSDAFDTSAEVVPPTRADVVMRDTFHTSAEGQPPMHADMVPHDMFETSAEVVPPTRADVVPCDTFDTSAEVELPTHADVVPRDAFDTSAEVEPPMHADMVPSDTFDTSMEADPPMRADMVPLDTFDASTATLELQVDASLQTDPQGVSSSEKIDLQSFELDVNGNKPSENAIASEIKIDGDRVREISEENHQNVEFRENGEVVNKDAVVLSNAQNSVYNGIFGEDFGTVGTHDNETNPVSENVLLDERENPDQQVTFEMREMNVENILTSNRVSYDESTHPAVENNTDFLNFDDDDGADAGGEYVSDMDAMQIIDNSGWSTRTKAVTKYLQMMFDKEGERGRNMLAVNNLLVGKTRKEASRMFFETLVLKTKDYIQVEQADPFGNINIFPRAKLLKSDF